MGLNYDEQPAQEVVGMMPNKETPSPQYVYDFDAAFFRLALHRAGYDPYDIGTGRTVWAKTKESAARYVNGDVKLLFWLDAPLSEDTVIVIAVEDGGYIVRGRMQRV